MNSLTKRLQLSVSVSAFAAAFAALAPHAAMAQPANATGTDQAVEEVTVTGTNIRGVAPVGSHVDAVTQEDIQAIAPISISEVVNTLPVISQANTLPQDENSYAFFSPNIHHLSSSNGNSTLVVIDGMRMAGGGSQGLEADPNIIPTEALARVEVLADGASSIYGSDAVAGVVNFITRKTYEGLEVNGQAGWGKGYNSQNLDMIWGTKWDGGGVYVASSYSFGSNIPIADRPYLAAGDFRPEGGTDQDSYSCSPATIVTPQSGTAVYLNAQATTTIPGSAGTNVNSAPCNNSIYGDLVAASERINVMSKINQSFFGGKLNITNTMYLNSLHEDKTSGPGGITATVYGAGAQANPFFQAPAGQPGATQETIRWEDLDETRLPSSSFTEDVLENEFDAVYDITDSWHVTANWVVSKNITDNATYNGFCTQCAYLAVNGTAQSSGSTTTTDIGGANVIATSIPLNSPAGTPYLTTSNALDVWNPVGSNKTSQTVLNSLYSSQTVQLTDNATNQLRLATDAALFDLGAGEIHAALGGEYYSEHVTRDATGSDSTGSTGTGSTYSHQRLHRNVGSAFAEVQVPLISPDMSIPLMQKVSIDVSGRYDAFSDVGHTGNPKYAIDWTVFDGLKARANYSTSFVAPPLTAIGDPTFGYAQGVTGAATDGSESNTPVANFPLVATVPGAICSAGTQNAGQLASLNNGAECQYVTVGQNSGTTGDQGIARQLGGGTDNIKPQTGINWTAGVDFTPDFIPGLDVSATFFHTAFKGEVNAAHWQQTTNAAPLFKFLQFYTPANGYPNGATPAIINAFGNVPTGGILGTLPAGNVYYTWAHDETNFLYLRIEGIDLDANYTYDAGSWGVFKAGDFLSLFTQAKEGYDGKSYFSILGESGFNGTISSENFDNRTSFGWSLGAFSSDLAINFTPSYRNWISTSVAPLISNPLTGTPIGGGDKVNSWTTLDLNLAYNFADGWLGGDQFYVHSRNIFDTRPPFYNGSAGGSGSSAPAFGYNVFNASPLGRTVSFGIRAKF